MENGERKLVDDVLDETKKEVECLGLTFKDDEERKRYFSQKLLNAFNELEDKLGDVPFLSADDAVEKLKSLEKWPVGDDEQIREIAEKMRRNDHEKDLLQRWKDEVGFPHGSIEDIMKLSDPPYYTLCPNPFIGDYVDYYGRPYDPREEYHREPFSADVSEGKNDPIYNAHTYHTKVPHKAIMRYILHYTEPGDIVFDGFCGTGMTGVAAQLCGDRKTVESLGYRVEQDGTVFAPQEDEEGKASWKPFSKLGPRGAVLNDLSPAATFIACNYNSPVDPHEFEREAKRILEEVRKECGWMYATLNTEGVSISRETVEELAERVRQARSADEVKRIIEENSELMGEINYIVWSDVFVCPNCSKEIIFWQAAFDKRAKKVRSRFSCPHCQVEALNKREMERAWASRFDKEIGQQMKQAKQIPVMVNYKVGRKHFEKTVDLFDLAIVEKTEELEIPYWCPTTPIPEGEKTVEPLRLGITHVHHFYTKRNLYILADLFAKSGAETLIVFQSIAATLCSKLVLYNLGRRGNGVLPGTLYLSSLQAESNVILRYNAKLSAFLAAFRKVSSDTLILVSTHNASVQMLAPNALDYIFTDPPFGGNLMYSELNFLWEAWLRVFTNNKEEAIENKVQGKGLAEYQKIMERCFKEYYRVLKPGRWMTVVFHNSKNSVWNAIQEGLWRAGFVVADVRTLDKQQGTFNQATAAGAVKKDLVISAYKPNQGLEERFKLRAGTEEGVWDFVRTHLKQLASVSSKEGLLEAQQERMDYMLYDRMVAFHVQRGIMVPMSAAEFYAGLEERFPKRDGMYFLPDQAAEYDRKKMQSKGLKQLDLFVRDEDSAILWVKQQLSRKPQTFQELHPQFTKESIAWVKFEKHVELADLLKENFLCYDGTGPIPNQIVSWLKCSEKYRDKINEIEAKHGTASSGGLETDDPELISAAKDRWYVPNPNQAADLEKLREKALLREFQEYRESSQRKLKAFRLEAVKAGFKKAWQDKDYHTIVDVADKLPEEVVQEDPKILMWYNQAVTKVGRE